MTDLPENQLSLFYKILVLVENEGGVTVEDLKPLGNLRQTLGALGRLEGLNLVERTKDTDKDSIILTEKGDTTLASILNYLPSNKHTWDNKWRIIVFDVPENRRTVRQMFRLKLMDLGARMLQSSVWISPYPHVVEAFRAIVKEHDFLHSVHCFEAHHISDEPINVASLWKLDSVARSYQTLFAQFRKELPRLKKAKDPSYQAKCMIVRLALICKQDPHLPPALMPKQWVGFEAQEWYETLRPFCE